MIPALHDMLHDERICGACAGSGEGRYDGWTCSTCRGNGAVRPTDEDWQADLKALLDEAERIGCALIHIDGRRGKPGTRKRLLDRLADIRRFALGFIDGAPDAPVSVRIAQNVVSACDEALGEAGPPITAADMQQAAEHAEFAGRFQS